MKGLLQNRVYCPGLQRQCPVSGELILAPNPTTDRADTPEAPRNRLNVNYRHPYVIQHATR